VALHARMCTDVDPEWSSVDFVRVGSVPVALGTPQLYVVVADDEDPVLRVDVYSDPDCFAFQDAILWRGNLVIGFGSHVHAVALADHSVVSIALEMYFGHLYPTDDYLLLASGTRLHRMEPDRSISWTSEPLGIDGVVVDQRGPTIRGEGEWDPPGGWRPFAVMAADGNPQPAP